MACQPLVSTDRALTRRTRWKTQPSFDDEDLFIAPTNTATLELQPAEAAAASTKGKGSIISVVMITSTTERSQVPTLHHLLGLRLRQSATMHDPNGAANRRLSASGYQTEAVAEPGRRGLPGQSQNRPQLRRQHCSNSNTPPLPIPDDVREIVKKEGWISDEYEHLWSRDGGGSASLTSHNTLIFILQTPRDELLSQRPAGRCQVRKQAPQGATGFCHLAFPHPSPAFQHRAAPASAAIKLRDRAGQESEEEKVEQQMRYSEQVRVDLEIIPRRIKNQSKAVSRRGSRQSHRASGRGDKAGQRSYEDDSRADADLPPWRPHCIAQLVDLLRRHHPGYHSDLRLVDMVAWVLADTAQEGVEAEDEECNDDDLVTNDLMLHDDGFLDIDTRMRPDEYLGGVGDMPQNQHTGSKASTWLPDTALE
ncbi:6178_t:CDS:10 [Scutellospora calospora]|uniref:6178_t:CDS:1 n=1 Tax=Scutellospora calospora TaxID=85575 RepID=A0ACA9L1M4_9GLOM|nr:6178_t:CDS:10 [Scutellospora calospora]